MILTEEVQEELKSWFKANYDGYVDETEEGEDPLDYMVGDAIADLDLDEQNEQVEKDVRTMLDKMIQDRQ